jgi:hypothetical protein
VAAGDFAVLNSNHTQLRVGQLLECPNGQVTARGQSKAEMQCHVSEWSTARLRHLSYSNY